LLWLQGRVPEAIEHQRTAKEMLADRPPSVERTRVLLNYWRNLWLAGLKPPDEINDEALADAERLGRRDLMVTALINRALRLGFGEGDRAAFAENERAIAIAREIGAAEISRGYINQASLMWWFGDQRGAAELVREGHALAQRFGDVLRTRFLQGEIIVGKVGAGEWEAARAEAVEFVEGLAASPHYMEVTVRQALATMSFAQGDDATADRELARSVELAETIGDPQATVPVTATQARWCAERGDRAGARDALVNRLRPAPNMLLDPALIEAAFAASLIGEPELLASALASASAETPWTQAVERIMEGRLADAADLCETAGNLHYAALLGLYAVEAGEDVEPARREQVVSFFRETRADRYLRRLDEQAAEAV
jgi:hypothetical protein